MIKAAIVEDNFVALNVLKKMIINYFSDIELVGDATNVEDGIQMLKTLNPDLVFLDIELPDGNAFNILDSIDNYNFKVIFVTSHDNYAIKAIKFSALDYILKPVLKKDLIEAVVRFKKSYSTQSNFDLQHLVLKENITGKSKKVVLSTSKEVIVVDTTDIVRLKSDSFYTNVFLKNGDSIFLTKTLKEFENMLSDYGFVRIHNSHLVNIKCITSFNKKEGGSVVLNDNTMIPVSRRKKSKLISALENENAK